MPRSNRPRVPRGARRAPSGPGREAPGAGVPSGLAGREERYAGQTWAVRTSRPNDSGRSFLCPGCQQQIASGQAHLVVWPVEAMSGVENRRHWHTVCWQARDRRPPGGAWA